MLQACRRQSGWHAPQMQPPGIPPALPIVAKVKPAVISVQVKIDNSAKMTGMNQNGKGHIPSAPGSQMDRFF